MPETASASPIRRAAVDLLVQLLHPLELLIPRLEELDGTEPLGVHLALVAVGTPPPPDFAKRCTYGDWDHPSACRASLLLSPVGIAFGICDIQQRSGSAASPPILLLPSSSPSPFSSCPAEVMLLNRLACVPHHRRFALRIVVFGPACSMPQQHLCMLLLCAPFNGSGLGSVPQHVE